MEFQFIGESVKRYRERFDLSLAEFATSSGVSRSMLCQLEMGKTVPTLTVAAKLASAMDVSLAQLIDPGGETESIFRLVEMNTVPAEERGAGGYVERFLNHESCRKEVCIRQWDAKQGTELSIDPCKARVRSYLILDTGKITLRSGTHRQEVQAGQFVEVRRPQNGMAIEIIEASNGYWVHSYP